MGRRAREDELCDDGGQWEDGGRWEVGGGWEGRGQWEPARRIDSLRNTGFAHVVQEAVRKERGAADCYKTVDLIRAAIV